MTRVDRQNRSWQLREELSRQEQPAWQAAQRVLREVLPPGCQVSLKQALRRLEQLQFWAELQV